MNQPDPTALIESPVELTSGIAVIFGVIIGLLVFFIFSKK